jgi:hypothetical protein
MANAMSVSVWMDGTGWVWQPAAKKRHDIRTIAKYGFEKGYSIVINFSRGNI